MESTSLVSCLMFSVFSLGTVQEKCSSFFTPDTKIAFYKTGKENNQTFMNLEIISKKIMTNLAQY